MPLSAPSAQSAVNRFEKNGMSAELAAIENRPRVWPVVAAVFGAVLIAQLALVAACGTDIPFHDQWNIEGQWLYPAWRDGTLTAGGLLQPFNEHRILWTHLLNLGLFTANGQWDPLVQLAAIAVLRAACAAGLAWIVAREFSSRGRIVVAAVVALAFLPHLAWHNVLWGIESHAYFSLGFSLATLVLLGPENASGRRIATGVTMGIAGLFAMGPAALVPVALVGLAILRAIARRRIERAALWRLGPVALLLVLGWWLRAGVPEHAALKAHNVREFLAAAARVLGWPHVNAPLAAVAVNLPLLLLVGGRVFRWRVPSRGEDFVVLVGGWSVAIGLATAWVRGGSAELMAGVPSRYVDFVVLLPLANAWGAVVLAREASVRWKSLAPVVAGAWGAFLLMGWLGLSAEVWRGLVLPRARDREAPVRLAREFQITGNAAVFDGKPLLLVPHPNPEAVRAVLNDPRLHGALPPSLQPEQPMGPLSRGVRLTLGHQ